MPQRGGGGVIRLTSASMKHLGIWSGSGRVGFGRIRSPRFDHGSCVSVSRWAAWMWCLLIEGAQKKLGGDVCLGGSCCGVGERAAGSTSGDKTNGGHDNDKVHYKESFMPVCSGGFTCKIDIPVVLLICIVFFGHQQPFLPARQRLHTPFTLNRNTGPCMPRHHRTSIPVSGGSGTQWHYRNTSPAC